MRFTRRGRLIALAAGLTLVMSACSTGGSSNKTASKGQIEGNAAGLFHPGEGRISSTELRDHTYNALKGKTLAYVPIGLGIPLTEEWGYVLKSRAQEFGMNYVQRDPNWSSTGEAQAVTALLGQKPDVLVLHNPDVELLANQIKQAQDQGIYVIQINMVSNYKSDAYVGADWIRVGEMVANDIVQNCGQGTSGKVQIIEGPKTSAASLDQLTGAMNVLSKHPEIKIVSDQ